MEERFTSEQRKARPTSRVYTYAARPMAVSLASRKASSSVEKVKMGATGPNVSCMRESLVSGVEWAHQHYLLR